MKEIEQLEEKADPKEDLEIFAIMTALIGIL